MGSAFVFVVLFEIKQRLKGRAARRVPLGGLKGGSSMGTFPVALLLVFLYAVMVLLFLRFFGFLTDRDAEIRKLLGSRDSIRKTKIAVQKRRLKLARS